MLQRNNVGLTILVFLKYFFNQKSSGVLHIILIGDVNRVFLKTATKKVPMDAHIIEASVVVADVMEH